LCRRLCYACAAACAANRHKGLQEIYPGLIRDWSLTYPGLNHLPWCFASQSATICFRVASFTSGNGGGVLPWMALANRVANFFGDTASQPGK
jgi:hypothetical protein